MSVRDVTQSPLIGPLLQGLMLVLLALPAAAQEASPATRQATGAEGASSPDTYRIGPGDVLGIEVTGIGSEKVRVSNSGKIHLALLGILRVADMTPPQLQSEIAALLVDRGLIRSPWVTVRVTEYLSQPVYILGEVELPGQYAIKGEMYLGDLIALSNGPTELASPIVYLYRRKPDAATLPPEESPTEEAIRVDLHALNEGRHPEQNYKLRGGDVIYVGQAADDFFYVVGDVNSPARYTLKRGGLTVSRAIALAGGPLRTAKLSQAMLVRIDRNGARQQLRMDIGAILRGRQPDVSLETGDILYVPGSATKSLAYAMSAVAPGVVVGGLLRIPR